MEIIVKKRVSNEKRGRGSDCVKDRLNILEREIREGGREGGKNEGINERIETEKCLQVKEGRNKSYNNDLYLLES